MMKDKEENINNTQTTDIKIDESHAENANITQNK